MLRNVSYGGKDPMNVHRQAGRMHRMTLLSCLLASALVLPGCGGGAAPAELAAASVDGAVAIDLEEKRRSGRTGGRNRDATTPTPTTSVATATPVAEPTSTAPGTATAVATAGPLVPATAAGRSIGDPQLARLYGPGTQVMDALANVRVGEAGGYAYLATQRFRAPRSGHVASIKAVWPAGSGYAAGNGGVIRLRILPDDGTSAHAPVLDAAALAFGEHRPGLVAGQHRSPEGNFAQVSLVSNAPLVAGRLYHVVYENVAAAPAVDYASVDYSVVHSRNGRPARWLDPVDWGAVFGYRVAGGGGPPTWVDVSRSAYNGAVYAPILQVRMADGAVFGSSPMESGNVEGRQWTVTAGTPVRERFAPKASRVITGLSFSTAATVAGSLRWELREGGTVLAAGRVTEAVANYASQPYGRAVLGVLAWYDVPLPAPVALAAGGVYDLVFTPEGASQWRFADFHNGSTQGFDASVAFTESRAQHLLNGVWIDANHWNHASPGAGANWRVVLHAAP